MQQSNNLKRPESFKKRKRKGCGIASGQGKTCGSGQDGQRSRSGSKRRAWFEGGQMPLQRRVPKRGFKNYCRKNYQIVNISDIERIGVSEIDPQIMKDKGIIRSVNKKVKVLGKGEIKSAVKIVADAFTQSALDKIAKAGGEVLIREFPLKTKVDQEA